MNFRFLTEEQLSDIQHCQVTPIRNEPGKGHYVSTFILNERAVTSQQAYESTSFGSVMGLMGLLWVRLGPKGRLWV